MPEPKNPEDSAKEAAEDAGKPGDFVVKAMRRLGQTGKQMSDLPGKAKDAAVGGAKKAVNTAVDETKKSFRDTKKLVGLKKGGKVKAKKLPAASSGAMILDGFYSGSAQRSSTMGAAASSAAAPASNTANTVAVPASGASAAGGLRAVGTGGGSGTMAPIAPAGQAAKGLMAGRGSGGGGGGTLARIASKPNPLAGMSSGGLIMDGLHKNKG